MVNSWVNIGALLQEAIFQLLCSAFPLITERMRCQDGMLQLVSGFSLLHTPVATLVGRQMLATFVRSFLQAFDKWNTFVSLSTMCVFKWATLL